MLPLLDRELIHANPRPFTRLTAFGDGSAELELDSRTELLQQ